MNTSLLLPLFACCLLAAAAKALEVVPEDASAESRLRNVTGELTLNNGLPWGSWGPAELCEEGSFVFAFEIKYEVYSTVDDTGVNGVKLYCRNHHDHDTGYVTSTVGEYGEWQGMRICSIGFMTGMRANVLESQGVFKDDVAVENVEMRCNNGSEVHTGFDGISSVSGLKREKRGFLSLLFRWSLREEDLQPRF